MLLKFKNKYLLALDKMIKEASETGGIIDCIILDPKEAYGLLLELVGLGSKYILNLTIHDGDNEDVTREKLLWGSTDKHERIKEIIQLWYKNKYEIKFKSIKLIVVKPIVEKNPDGWMEPDPAVEAPQNVLITKGGEPPKKSLDVPKPPPPPGRTIKEGEQPPKPPTARSVTGKETPKKSLEVPKPPKMPPNRMLNKDECGIFGGRKLCDKCGSSLKTKWMLFNVGGCIQPECENYWERYRD